MSIHKSTLNTVAYELFTTNFIQHIKIEDKSSVNSDSDSSDYHQNNAPSTFDPNLIITNGKIALKCVNQ